MLREHDFRQLFAAQTTSLLGSQVSLLALPLTAVLALDASTFQVGLLTAAGTLAFLLVGLPAGAWVDRMRRRPVLIAADLGRAAVLGSVPLAWAFDVLTLPQLYVVALATGTLTVFFDVAYQSYLPHLIGRDRLVEGNAKLESVRGVGEVGGRTLGGLLIQALSAPVAIGADALSFLLSAAFVRRIRAREDPPVRAPGAHLGREIMAGLRFVVGIPALRAIALSTGISNLCSAIRTAVLVVLLARVIGLGAGAIGAFFAVVAVGALGGALVATRIGARLGPGTAIWTSTAAIGLFGLAVPLADRGWPLVLAAVGFGAAAAANVVYNVVQISFRQALTPEHLLGRLNATMRFLVWGTIPLGGVLGGVLGELLGVRAALWVAAVAQLLPVLPVYFSPLRRIRTFPTPDRTLEDSP